MVTEMELLDVIVVSFTRPVTPVPLTTKMPVSGAAPTLLPLPPPAPPLLPLAATRLAEMSSLFCPVKASTCVAPLCPIVTEVIPTGLQGREGET